MSTFYNDMFAFDLERRRWYKLGLKQKKAKLSTTEKKEARRVKQKSAADGADGADGDDQSDTGSFDEGSDMDDSGDEADAAEGASASGAVDAVRAEKGDFFGYIDETGNVVYINLKDEDEGEGMQVESDTTAVGGAEAEQGSEMAVEDTVQSAAEGLDRLAVTTATATTAATATAGDEEGMVQELRSQETLKNQLKYQARGKGDAATGAQGAVGAAVGAEADMVGEDGISGMVLDEVAVEMTADGPVSGVKAGAASAGTVTHICLVMFSTWHCCNIESIAKISVT